MLDEYVSIFSDNTKDIIIIDSDIKQKNSSENKYNKIPLDHNPTLNIHNIENFIK